MHNVNENHKKSSRKYTYIMIKNKFGGYKFKKTNAQKMSMSVKAFLWAQPIYEKVIPKFSECDLSRRK